MADFEKTRKTVTAKPPLDPDRHKCCWRSMGIRCANMGTRSDSITGSDYWYCTEHFNKR